MLLRKRGALLLVVLSCLADFVSAEARWTNDDHTEWHCGKLGHTRKTNADENFEVCGEEVTTYNWEMDGPYRKSLNKSTITCPIGKPSERRRRMAQREFSNRRDSPVMVRLLQEIG